jgi:serine/threonine-protein kinase HipA
MTKALTVYFQERKAGLLLQDDGGALSFQYDPNYLASDQPRAISIAMPLREEA